MMLFSEDKHITTHKDIGQQKLQSLLELTNAINANSNYDILLSIFERIIKEQLHLQKFLLLIKRETWTIASKSEVEVKLREIDVENDLCIYNEVSSLGSKKAYALHEFDYVIPVLHKQEQLAFLLIAKDWSGNADLAKLNSFLQTITNILVMALENKRLSNQAMRQIELKKELEIAKEMQQFLFPQDLPQNEFMDVSAKYLTYKEVGGDYYDFFAIAPEKYIMCIADVSGKGVSAALLMANFQACVRSLSTYNDFTIQELICELNRIVYANAKGEKFITFFIGVMNLETRVFTYINAGHNSPILINGKENRFLDKGTTGLGMFPELPFLNSESITVDKNVTIALYTDGVIELLNNRNEQFDVHRLIKTLHSFYSLKTDDMNALLFSKLDEWRGTNDFVDDTAILTCRFY
jgi:sigma-B regulation protein RsbU (phosphoserine phosphatase)